MKAKILAGLFVVAFFAACTGTKSETADTLAADTNIVVVETVDTLAADTLAADSVAAPAL